VGLADECVPADQLRDRAMELAHEIGSNAPLALRAIKSTLRLGLGDRVREITKREASIQEQLSNSDDAKEGIASVGERRQGNFTGR
jgi:enoyl-CoA hydratase/carnithine racemase